MDQQEKQPSKNSTKHSQRSEYNNVWISKTDWNNLKKSISKSAPIYSFILIIFTIGFWTGSHFQGQDIVLDCKYASSFRVGVDSFECRRKL